MEEMRACTAVGHEDDTDLVDYIVELGCCTGLEEEDCNNLFGEGGLPYCGA